MPTPQGDAAFLERSNGRADNGRVAIDDFDRGLIETLGATVQSYKSGPEGRPTAREGYFWTLDTIKPPPGMPGVPIIFGTGEDTFERFKIPYVKITPTGLTPAMNRYHPMTVEYRAPAPTARQAIVGGVRGADRYEEKQQAHPFDLAYTITVLTKRRSMPSKERSPGGVPSVGRVEGGSSNMLLTEVLRVYPSYCGVNVQDSVGDYRVYSAFMEGTSPADEVNEVGDRVVGYAITLRVEGELDLDPTRTFPAVTRALTLRTAPR